MYCPLTRDTTSAFSGITTDASEHCCGFWQYCRLKDSNPEGAEFPSALSSVACALPCGACRVCRASSARDVPCGSRCDTESILRNSRGGDRSLALRDRRRVHDDIFLQLDRGIDDLIAHLRRWLSHRGSGSRWQPGFFELRPRWDCGCCTCDSPTDRSSDTETHPDSRTSRESNCWTQRRTPSSPTPDGPAGMEIPAIRSEKPCVAPAAIELAESRLPMLAREPARQVNQIVRTGVARNRNCGSCQHLGIGDSQARPSSTAPPFSRPSRL